MPVLARRASLASLARLWGLVFCFNLVGAAIFGAFLAILAPALGIASPAVFHHLASKLVDHAWWVILLSALLAGWLMGTLSWLIAASRDTISQVVFVWLIAGIIGFAHLHHPITAAVEVTVSILLGGGARVAESMVMLAWSTIGTSLGGLIFAVLISYGHRIGDDQHQPGSNGTRTSREHRQHRQHRNRRAG
jgi:formate-nitrite transporter family protein